MFCNIALLFVSDAGRCKKKTLAIALKKTRDRCQLSKEFISTKESTWLSQLIL